MLFIFRDIFRDDDNEIMPITEEDFGYVMDGLDAKLFKINIENDIEKELNDALVKDFFGYKKAIIKIKSNNSLTLFDQSTIISTIRNINGCELEVIYGCSLTDKTNPKIKIIILASK